MKVTHFRSRRPGLQLLLVARTDDSVDDSQCKEGQGRLAAVTIRFIALEVSGSLSEQQTVCWWWLVKLRCSVITPVAKHSRLTQHSFDIQRHNHFPMQACRAKCKYGRVE